MITIENYIKPKDLAEAYELNKKKYNRIIGGMMWVRLGSGRVKNILDLSNLLSNEIIETKDEFIIGAMCTLRNLELNRGLEQHFEGAVRESIKHIVGIQFRGQATVGGSVFGRFGFSDILTCLLALNCQVKLYNGGIISLKEFAKSEDKSDILESIILKKDCRKVCYMSRRRQTTDFPIVSCCVAKTAISLEVAIGARPMRASAVMKPLEGLDLQDNKNIKQLAIDIISEFTFQTNMRGSKEYRKELAIILLERGIEKIMKGESTWN